MNGKYLKQVESEKVLGTVANHSLSWEDHINRVVSNSNRKLALLNTHILPHVDNIFMAQKLIG